MATTRLRRQRKRRNWEAKLGDYIQSQRRGGMLAPVTTYSHPRTQRQINAARNAGRHFEFDPALEENFIPGNVPLQSSSDIQSIYPNNLRVKYWRAYSRDEPQPAELDVRMLDIIHGNQQNIRESTFSEVNVQDAEEFLWDYIPRAPWVTRFSAFRGEEIQSLREAGEFWNLIGDAPQNNDDNRIESAYRYRGIDHIRNYGPAWLTLYFALSDLIIFQAGLSTLVMIFHDIAEDIVSMGVPPLTRIMLDIEGNTDPDPAAPGRTGRSFLQIVAHTPADDNAINVVFTRTITLYDMINSPEAVFDVIARAFQSDRYENFNMKRLYVSILIEARGGVDGGIPDKVKKVRDKLKRTCSGFKPIEDTKDNSCGLQALLHGLLCANQSVIALSKKSPSLKLVPMNKVLENNRKQISRKKVQLFDFKQDQFAFLSQSFGWKVGTPISYQQLNVAIRSFNMSFGTQFGLLIFDGLKPFRRPFVSFSCHPSEVPANEHMIALIYFQWGDTGHYDWLHRRSIVQFVRGEVKKNMGYDFVSLRCMGRGVKPRDGFQCSGCLGCQTLMFPEDWEKKHNGNDRSNKINCGDCGRFFRSEDCYTMHRVKQKNQKETACEKLMLCATCERSHPTDADCSLKWCKGCGQKYQKIDTKPHTCYIYAISNRKLKKVNDVIYADIESKRVEDKKTSKLVQQAYSVSAYYLRYCSMHKLKKKKKCVACADLIIPLSCSACLLECKCKWTWVYFEGSKCIGDFLEWLLDEHALSRVVMHNGGKYDFQLISEFICYDRRFTKTDVCRGLKILTMTVFYDTATEDEVKKRNGGVCFVDSLNFIPSALRGLSKMFNLPIMKGHFPFEILNVDGWEIKFRGKKPPPLLYFGFSDMEIKEKERLSENRRHELNSINLWIEEWKEEQEYVPQDELRKYNIQDVVLLQQACDMFRQNFRNMVGVDPFQYITTPAAVAASYRQDRFMPPESIQSFSVPDRQWQRTAIRGGRTEPFKLYYKCREGETIKVVDINSSYPFQQSYKNYPVGEVSFDQRYEPPASFLTVAKDVVQKTHGNLWDILNDPTGRYGCGIIECEWVDVTYDYIPVLPLKVKMGSSEKLLFQAKSGKWTGFISLLAAAIKAKQVVVRYINRLQLWVHTSPLVFQKYMLGLYAKKVEATGWPSILKEMPADSKNPKEEFLAECFKRKLHLNEDSIKENPGLKATSKIQANSCWGYFTQKATRDSNQYFDNDDKEDVETMGDFLESLGTETNPNRIVGKIVGVGRFTRVHSTLISPLDEAEEDKNKNVAYHVGGQVPAYGLQQITEGLHFLHPSQLLYTDTDSIAYVKDEKNPLHKDIATGPYLGDYSDEYPGYHISEYVCLGPKTYCLRIEKGDQMFFKTKFKGLPLLQSGFSVKDEEGKLAKVGMTEMKDLLEAALLSKMDGSDTEPLIYRFHYTNVFKKSNDFKISTVEEKKSLRFTFDKRKVMIPDDFKGLKDAHMIDTVPFSEDVEVYDKKEVEKWWAERREELTTYVSAMYNEMM